MKFSCDLSGSTHILMRICTLWTSDSDTENNRKTSDEVLYRGGGDREVKAGVAGLRRDQILQ